MWKQIIDFPNYEVSDDGRVRRAKSQRELKASVINTGYLRVNLRRDGRSFSKYVHRLVAETYLERPNDDCEVNHKDGNKANNTIQNLEWISHKKNVQHSYNELDRSKSKVRIKVTYLTGEVKVFETIKDCAAFYDVDPSTIRDYCDHALRPSRKV